MNDYGFTGNQKRVNYTELVRKYVNVEEMKAVDPPLWDDLIEQGFHRVDFKPSDVKDKVVVDLGAHVGVFTALAVAHGAARVFSVEMNPDNYAGLVKFTKNMPNVQCRNWAVSDDVTKFLYPNEAGTICKGHKTGDGPGIAAKSLDEIVLRHAWVEGPALLKMDIEGSEYDAVYCACGETLRRFDTVLMETHPPVGERGPARTAEFLKEYLGFFGFKTTCVTPIFFYTWDREGKITSCDRVKDLELVRLERT
jgi:FkbM family methyltransferase